MSYAAFCSPAQLVLCCFLHTSMLGSRCFLFAGVPKFVSATLSSSVQIVLCGVLSRFRSCYFLFAGVIWFVYSCFLLAGKIIFVLLYASKHIWFALLSAHRGSKICLPLLFTRWRSKICHALLSARRRSKISLPLLLLVSVPRFAYCCFLLAITFGPRCIFIVGVSKFVLRCFVLAGAISSVLLSVQKHIWFVLFSAHKRSKIYHAVLCARKLN